MKITLSAAMRARDVSRPSPEQLAEAAAKDEPRAAGEEARAARRDAAGPSPAASGEAQPRARRRRRPRVR
jgi:hypothetical protein